MDEAWSRFEVSGKITDYLKCKSMDSEMTQSAARGSNVAVSSGNLQKVGPDGTEYRSDRNGLERNADWRI